MLKMMETRTIQSELNIVSHFPLRSLGEGAFCAIIDEMQLPLKKTAW